MVSSRSWSVVRRHKETGSYYIKLDGYDMVTLCASTESRIGKEEATIWIGFWTEDIILRYYGFFPLVIGGLPTEGDGKLLLLEIGWIWYGYSLLIDRVEDRREEATIWIGFWTEDIILRYYDFFPLVIGGLPTEGDGKLILHEIGWIWYGHSLHRQSRG